MAENIGLSHPKETSAYALGWLIQNQEYSDADLCALLLKDYSRPLELLALALAPGPAEQVRLVEDTIAFVLANRRNYRSDVSGPVWLYSAALRLAQAGARRPLWAGHGRSTAGWAASHFIQPLDPGSHWAGLLKGLGSDLELLALGRYALGLSGEELGQVLGLAEAQVLAALAEIQGRLTAHAEECAECRAQFLRLADVESGLRGEYAAQAGLLKPSASVLENWQAALVRRARAETSMRRRRSIFLQASQASIFVLLALAGIWLAGRSWPQTARQQPTPQTAAAGAALPTMTALPAAAAVPQPDPSVSQAGNQDANLAVILWQANNSQRLWKSLWADVQTIDYDIPVGEVMADQVLRKQVWLQQPGTSRVIAGPLGGNPTRTSVVKAGSLQELNLENGQTTVSAGEDLLSDFAMRRLFLPGTMLVEGADYHLVGRGSAAGRSAWIVDSQYFGAWSYRFWIDERYGVILRLQTFSRDLSGELVSDQKTTAIYFDVDFPAAIFQTDVYNPAHYANDPSGVPEIPNYAEVLAGWPERPVQHIPIPAVLQGLGTVPPIPPGPDFYPGSLTFQKMAATSQGLQSAFELLAGGNSLGTLPVGGGSIVSCQRSADRRMIAYASGPPGALSTSLYVADLTALQATRPVLPGGITAGDYVFSPDSRKLAFFGCDHSAGVCGVFVLDILSGKLTRIQSVSYADYIIWKPDGKSLAFVGNQIHPDLFEQTRTKNLMQNELIDLAQIWHFYVVDPANGDVLYRRTFDWKTLSAPPDSPTLTWTTPFKLRAAGLEGCAS